MMLQKTGDPLAIPYYLFIVIIGSFFILNLLLAVIIDSFKNERTNDDRAFEPKSEENKNINHDTLVL